MCSLWRLALFVFCLLLIAAGRARAQAEQPAPNPGAPNWTHVENLNPNALTRNSLIKQKWAVVVGVGRFRERRLDGAERPDEAAMAFQRYLIDPHAGRFDEHHVKVLLNEQATQKQILAAVGPFWLGRLAGPDDLVVIFLATNSFPTTDGNAYLCTHDCALDNIYASCLSLKTLMTLLKQNVRASRIVLIVQSSYSGMAELNSGAKAIFKNFNFDPEKMSLGTGQVLISSSQPGQMSWGNIFTASLINALKADDGLVPLDTAFTEARAQVEAKTSQTPGLTRQTPAMKSAWKGHDLILGVPAAEPSAAIPQTIQAHAGAEALYLQANKLVQDGQLDEAIADYKLALADDPHYADVLADYGAVLSMKADWSGAAGKYQQAIQVNPSDSLYHANYARVLYKLGKREECRAELETALRLEPRDTHVLSALADRCLEAGDTARSIELLRQALVIYPGSGELHNKLSYAASADNQVELALAEAEQAVKLDNGSPAARLNLGTCFLLNHRPELAIATYKGVAERWPDNPDAHLLLSRAFEEIGDKLSAQAELAAFIARCPAADKRIEMEKQHLNELERAATTNRP